ncbi:MAG TPA: EAL domain-containing protein [Roseiarcus sp.]|jgi:diguanylate cyclase (GGDEF)-like protein/PAS domain S-box-containing protein
MRVNPKGRSDVSSDDSAIAALLRVAAESQEAASRDREPLIADLQAQAIRYQTAIASMSPGVSLFDNEDRLVLCNSSYGEIYGLSAEDTRPGLTLREITERRIAVGTCPLPLEEYLALSKSINAAKKTRVWTLSLDDGRTVRIRHEPMADGGWVSIHEDVTELQDRQALARQRISLQALIDGAPDYFWIKDLDCRFVIANKALASDSGRERSDEMIGMTDFDLHPADVARVFFETEREILQTGQPRGDLEERVVTAQGEVKWFSTTKAPMRNAEGEICGLIGVGRDITARRRADQLRDGQAEILEMIAMGAALEAVLERIVRLIESQLSGVFGSVLLLDDKGLHLGCCVAPSLPEAYVRAIDGVAIGPNVGSCGSATYRRAPVVVSDIAADPLWTDFRDLALPHGLRSCWSTPILAKNGEALGAFALYSRTVREPMAAETRFVDLATHMAGIAIARKRAEDRIHFMANHDALTGLPNRGLLRDRLTQAMGFARRYSRWATVVFIDLDNFKYINDSLGHSAGDELLKAVAARMAGRVRATDTVVRLGGDEFVVLLFDQAKNVDAVSDIVRDLQEAIARPVELDGRRVRVTSSFGIANYPDDGTDVDTLLAHADAAMYRAKEIGRDNFQFYTPELNAKVQDKFLLQEDLRCAVQAREFILDYQPLVDMRTGRILAVEALIRWNHPSLGLLGPDKFIPLAEETGLIGPIGDWVLREACRQNKAWQDAGLPRVAVCVNVSARQFSDKNWVSGVIGALQGSGLAAEYLELELTESLIMQDLDQARATMRALQALGVHLSIDDFGTGYSSLSALKTFPVGRLKIDRSFISDLPHDEHDRAVAAAVISLGQKLNLRVVAEGVETDEQVAFLRENNCDEMQGYRISKPLAPRVLEAFLASQDEVGCSAA